mgnify:CR=1 FL=1
MALEIERKFLVASSEEYKASSNASDILQVYLTISEKMSIRVRIDGIVASLAIKSKVSHRVNREYEYNMPIDEARSIMKLNNFPSISKTRYQLENKGHTWEIDEFHDANAGLVIAEIELEYEDEVFEFPSWIGKEVTEDMKYLNSNLATHPFSDW